MSPEQELCNNVQVAAKPTAAEPDKARSVWCCLACPFAVSTAGASTVRHLACVESLWHRLLLLSGAGAGRRLCCDMSESLCLVHLRLYIHWIAGLTKASAG